MKLNFESNNLTFDSAGCHAAIMKMAEAYMNMTSDKMMEIMRTCIDLLGNGSHTMKADAKKAVREILHEVTNNSINIEVGVDEAFARSMSEQFFVRTMVVLHGNNAEGPIHTKPGRSTWKKHLNYRSVNTRSKSVYDIPDFDWRLDYTQSILDWTMRDIEKYFKDMLKFIEANCTADFFASFIK